MTAVESGRTGIWRAWGTALLALMALPATASAQEVATSGSGSVQPWMSIIQGIGYVSILLAVGLIWFQVFVVGAVDRQALRIGTVAAVIATLANIPMIPLWVAREEGGSASAIFDAEYWKVGVVDEKVRAITFIVFGLAVALWLARGGARSRRDRWGVFLGGLVALGSMTIVGHTADIGNTWLMHGSDFVHGVVAAVWFGGLIGLARYLRGAMREPSSRATPVEAASVVGRYSTIAGWALVGLAGSGLIISARLLGGVSELWESDFGRVLLTKLSIVVVVVALAGWNRFRLVPVVSGKPVTSDAWRHLRTTVVLEAALLVAVLVVTSVLVVTDVPAT